MDPSQIPDFFKDVAAQGGMVFTLTQVVKDQLIRWRAADLDDQATRAIALAFSLLVSAMLFAPVPPDWPRWMLNVIGYGTAVIFPAATAAHVVAHKMAQKPPKAA